MTILVDFTNFKKDIGEKELFIVFKKGAYKITNPNILKMIKTNLLEKK